MVSEDVREAVLHGQVAFGGESRQVAVLFTDIRGFTSLAEKTAPQEIIQALNDFFTVVAEATKQHHGIINQFGGDSVLVVFGAPIQRPQVESVSQAIQAAVDIRLGVTRLNARRLQQGQIPIRYGIGINCGQVIAGNLGVQERFEYTVIGDVVNVAARLQGLSRSFPQTPILITAEVLAAAPESLGLSYGDLGEFELKGKARPVSVHSVLGPIELQAPVFQNFSRLSNPVVNAMLACSLYCLGYRQRLIAECLQVPEDIVYTWLVSAHQFQEQIAPVLVGHFGVSPAHANWLHIPPEPVGLRELVPSGTTV
jgi:class 3 adenylate cyclase